MKPRQRLLYYLTLNVVVSVLTTLGVLWVWERTHPVTPALPGLPAPSLVPTLSFPVSSPTPVPTRSLTVYVVQEGDSLSSIAFQFGTSVEELMALNGLSNPNALGVGQTLFVPLSATPAVVGALTATAPPATGRLMIAEVFAPGDLGQEGVLIRRVGGSGKLSLQGWVLQDADGNRYLFPALDLFPDGAVTVFTRPGMDTVVELYWGQEQAVFSSGETLLLLDAEGREQARYTIP